MRIEMPLFGPKKQDGWLALAFAPGRLDVASVRRGTSGRPLVERLESYQRAGDDRIVLSRLAGRLGLRSHRCTVVLAGGEYHWLQADAPEVADRGELREAMRWKVKDMIDFPAEQATVDVLDLPLEGTAATRGRQCFVALAHNALLAPRICAFQDARVPLAVIDLPELAQRNVATLLERDNRGLALLNLTREGGLLTFTWKGDLYATRRIEITVDQFEAADAARRAELSDRIALEVQRSIDNFERMFSFVPLTGLALLDQPGTPGVVEFLRSYLSLPVETRDLAEVLDFPSVPELRDARRQAECLVPIGAALRSEEAA